MSGLKLAAVVAATFLLGLAPLGAAQAAYQDPTITVEVSDVTPTEGDTFTVDVSSPATCEWTHTFAGDSEEGAGKVDEADFVAPQVDRRTDYALVVRCDYDNTQPIVAPAETGSNLVTPAAIETATRTVTITVLPLGDNGEGAGGSGGSDGSSGYGESGSGSSSGFGTSDLGGVLPGTGGTSVDLLWIGGALVAAGAVATVAVRRRSRV
ncbi:hypothetical protein [Aeromicrobium wangtongii]|uniref:hypothetical protein n=1 Tax=Aeromicrobium wangtongii TaxID=2969247 RepID=UPI002016F670|nr:hypothetical protein [Aeromicrobium wangtongii]MCL3817590.1 hypothetical protein [Aeromicrobium wangtongii]